MPDIQGTFTNGIKAILFFFCPDLRQKGKIAVMSI